MTAHRSAGWLGRSLTAAGLVLVSVPLAPLLSLGSVAEAAANPPNGVNLNLEGCNRPAPVAACTGADMVNGNLGKNWSELDNVPHRLIIKSGSPADFGVQIAADYMHAAGSAHGYDRISNIAGPCVTSTGVNVIKTNIIGGAYQTITNEVVVHMDGVNDCTITWVERLAIGSHLFSGSSLQTQILNDDYSSTGQQTVSIPVKDVKPQSISVSALASHVTAFGWDVTKTGSSDVTLDSCAAPPTTPNVSYTVGYTKTADGSGAYTVTGTVTLGNPSSRALTTNSISATILDGARSTSVSAAAQHVTVPAATNVSGTLVPGTASTTFTTTLSSPLGNPVTATATATYQDPDNPGQTIDALASASTSVPLSVTDTPGPGATATITDDETLTGSAVSFKRTSAPAMAAFATSNSFSTQVSATGTFTISKIVKATQPANTTATLTNAVSLTRSGEQTVFDSAAADPITIHVTAAKPTIVVTKNVDLAPGSNATFGFTITSNDDASKSWTTTATVLAGATSGQSPAVTVDPSATGYTLTETTTPAGYTPPAAVQVTSLALCGATIANVGGSRTLGHVTVVKHLSGPVAGAATTFSFSVACPGLDPITLHVDASTGSGTTSTDDVIPTGVTCTITETGPPAGWTLTDVTPASGHATSGTGANAGAVTFTNTRDLSHVSVVKHLSGAIAGAGTTFTFTVTCPDLDPITLHVDASTGSGTASTDDVIPTGVTCTITETGSPNGWHLTATAPADGHATSGLGDGVDTVSFTNTRDLGHVTVVKQIAGPVAGAGTTFDFLVVCPGLDPITLHVDASTGSGTASTDDVIPTGVTCTVVESGSPDGWTLTQTVPGTGTATSAAGAAAGSVTFTNTRNLSHVTVDKELSGAIAGAGTTFDFTVTCPELAPMTLHVDASTGSGTASTDDVIPTGVTCTVTETGSPTGWHLTATNPADGTATSGAARGGDTVAFTNTRDLGHITVHKSLAGPIAGAGTTFTFTVTCPGLDPITLHVDASTGDGTASTDDVIPTGVTCTVTETGSPTGWHLTTTDPAGGTATSGAAEGGDIVSFTNTRDLGHVSVVKQVVGVAAGAGTAFTFTVTCPGLDPITLHVDASTGSGTASTDDVIPTGVSCTITEADAPSWSLSSTVPADGSAISGLGAVAGVVTFTNNRDLGHVTVVKQVTGAVTATDTQFTFTVTCPGLPPMTLVVDPVHGVPSASTPDIIPTGVMCAVTEVAKDGWLQVAMQPGSGLVPAGGGAASTVTVVNAQRTGALAIAKLVDKTSADADSRLIYTLTVVATGNLTQHDVVVTDALPGHDPLLGGSWPVTYISGSATCSTGCAATYDPQTHRLSWAIGDLAPPAKVTLGFAVTTGGPAPVTPEHVDNAATVSATTVDPIRSNTVRTLIVAVEPFHVTRPPRLAYTGFPSWLAPLGLLLLGTGLFLRRRGRA